VLWQLLAGMVISHLLCCETDTSTSGYPIIFAAS
jgi:hypothetical protein